MTLERVNRLSIRTPEGVTFSLVLAGPIARFLAWGIDKGVVITAIMVTNSLAAGLATFNPELLITASVLLNFVYSFGYGILFEWRWRGQTLGKRLLRLRVMDVQGLRLQFTQVAIRNLLRAVDVLPFLYFVGGTAMLLNRCNQRLGDLAANTIVARIPKLETPDFEQVLPGKYNSFRAFPHLEARLRQRVSSAEAALLVQALLRREALEPPERVALYGDIAEHFRGIVTFPEEATHGLTNEQYLRNLVDSVFRELVKAE